MPALAAVLILFFAGCELSYKPSLRSSDFRDALADNGYEPEIVDDNAKKLLQEDGIKSSSTLRLRLGDEEYVVDEYDLSTPDALADFRRLRTGFEQEANATLFRYENLNLVLTSQLRPKPEHLEIFKGLQSPIDYRQAGWFLYPLAACLFLAVFTFMERFIALFKSKTFPSKIRKSLADKKLLEVDWGNKSAAARILNFAKRERPSAEALRSFASLQVTSMEKGLFMLEIVVGAAPLVGLLGTVTGLVKVFSGMPAGSGLPDTGAFSEGIAMALLTTIIGLAIAIPALVGHSFLSRTVEKRSAEIFWLTEKLIDFIKSSDREQK